MTRDCSTRASIHTRSLRAPVYFEKKFLHHSFCKASHDASWDLCAQIQGPLTMFGDRAPRFPQTH